jgi:PadR family transcriptional regulator PadR
MSTQSDERERLALLQGTLDLLILRTLLLRPEHGQGIARTIQQRSDEAILVEHGSLYPALQRLDAQRLVRADWGVSENGRRARFYQLTPRGKKQLAAEASRWRAMTTAIGRVLGPALAEGSAP